MSNGGGDNGDQVTAAPSTGKAITEPRKSGLVWAATNMFESLGLLNKGSGDSAATPKAGDAAQTAGISSNALSVTRLGGSRHHHRAKQAEGWRLEQPEPGVLIWHTPSGRTYTTVL